jgi:hypothetical protein
MNVNPHVLLVVGVEPYAMPAKNIKIQETFINPCQVWKKATHRNSFSFGTSVTTHQSIGYLPFDHHG